MTLSYEDFGFVFLKFQSEYVREMSCASVIKCSIFHTNLINSIAFDVEDINKAFVQLLSFRYPLTVTGTSVKYLSPMEKYFPYKRDIFHLILFNIIIII